MTEQMLGELICEYTLQSTGSTTPQTARRGSCGTDQAPRPGRGFDLLRPEPRPLDRDDHGRLEARRPPDRITVRGKTKTEVKDDHLLPPLRYPPGQACLQPFSACAWEWRPVGIAVTMLTGRLGTGARAGVSLSRRAPPSGLRRTGPGGDADRGQRDDQG
jgi:hypothetical protein